MKQLSVTKTNNRITISLGPVTAGTGKRVNGIESTLKEMLAKIEVRNGGSLDFRTREAAEAALTAEEIARLAGIR